MSKEWPGTTYGNGWMHSWLVRMLKMADVRIFYAFTAIFVIPVCLIVNPSRGIIYRYFRRRMGHGPLKAAWKTYMNHCMFGQAVIDKFAMYAGKRFAVEVEGYGHFAEFVTRPESFVQFSAHVGNYEIAGYTLKCEGKSMNALVFWGEKESVMKGRTEMFGRTNIHMIGIRPDMSHLFDINNAMSRGDVVSLPADRIFGSEKKLTLPVLGAEADLPQGPFSLAAMRGLDVLAVNVMKSGMKKYKIYVTPLHYDKKAPRASQTKELAQAYVSELERVIRLHPTQWYNYFDFWKDKACKK